MGGLRGVLPLLCECDQFACLLRIRPCYVHYYHNNTNNTNNTNTVSNNLLLIISALSL